MTDVSDLAILLFLLTDLRIEGHNNNNYICESLCQENLLCYLYDLICELVLFSTAAFFCRLCQILSLFITFMLATSKLQSS